MVRRLYAQYFVALLLAYIIAGIGFDANAQEEGGAGFALLKPYSWSKQSEISEVIFYDRVVEGPLYTTFSEAGKQIQYDTARVVSCSPIPRPSDFQQITTDDDIQGVSLHLHDLQDICTKVPVAKKQLAPIITPLQEEITLYQQGNVKIDGAWISRVQWQKNQADAAAREAKQQAEMLAAEAQKQVEQKHQSLLSQINSPNTNYEQCDEIIAELAALNNPTDKEILKNWADNRATVLQLKQDTQRFLDKAVQNDKIIVHQVFKSISDVPSFPEDIQEQALNLKTRFSQVQAGLRFPKLINMDSEEARILSLIIHLAQIANDINKKDVNAAIEVLKNASQEAAENTLDRSSAVTKQLTSYELLLDGVKNEYEKHINIAKQLETSGKTSEAIKEYEQAYQMIMEPELSDKIKSLREQSLGL